MKLSIAWLILWFVFSIIVSFQTVSYQLDHSLLPATLLHPFGYDIFGRDFLSVVLSASFKSISFAFLIVMISFFIGTLSGMTISLLPKAIQSSSLWILELFLAFPSLLFSLGFAAFNSARGGSGWETLIFSLLIGTLPSIIRMSFVFSRELLAQDFVVAAKSLGAKPLRIMMVHLAPAVISFCAVKIPNLFAHALIIEATINFLGIGSPIGHDTWGTLLAQGKDYLIEAPNLALGAGLPLVLTILALQTLSTHLVRFFTNFSEIG
jgi:peptide/nickel transport system permease protein